MVPLRRALALTGVTFGLALGAPSVAMADVDFRDSFSGANAEGATLTVVHSHVDEDGEVTYEYVTYTATAHGATVDSVTSKAE